MTVCNVEGVTRSDNPRGNYYLILQLPSDLQSFLETFSSLFWFALVCIVSSSSRQLFISSNNQIADRQSNSFSLRLLNLVNVWSSGKCQNVLRAGILCGAALLFFYWSDKLQSYPARNAGK